MANESVIEVNDAMTNYINIGDLERKIMGRAKLLLLGDMIVIDIKTMSGISFHFFTFLTKVNAELQKMGISLRLRNHKGKNIGSGFTPKERASLNAMLEIVNQTAQEKEDEEFPWRKRMQYNSNK